MTRASIDRRMDNERWRLISPLLDRALALAGSARATWLAALEAEQPTLAGEIAGLLAEADLLERERYLEHPASPLFAAEASLAGQTFGAYTLETPLGHGGMGSVWLAHRSDGRFEGKVAIKLLNAALVGRAAEGRFRREGTILARLAHPNITRLIDAGHLYDVWERGRQASTGRVRYRIPRSRYGACSAMRR